MSKLIPNMVPAWEYVQIEYVPFKMIKRYHTAEEYRRFQKWIGGQTCVEDGCYPYDYHRWVRGGMPDRQGAEEFD